MIRIIITAALSLVDVDNLSNHVNLVFLSLIFSLNLFSPLLIAALSTTTGHETYLVDLDSRNYVLLNKDVNHLSAIDCGLVEDFLKEDGV